MIKAFFDESYNSNESLMFAVAGIVAQDRVWDQIEAGWETVLDEKNKELARQGREPLSRYHAAEMNAHDNEFKGWGQEETLQFTEKLLSAIRGRDIFILSFAVIMDEGRRLSLPTRRRRPGTLKRDPFPKDGGTGKATFQK